jgi:hypothetical protein
LGVLIVTVELLAGPRFPCTGVPQVIADVNGMSPVQSSLGGAGLVTQILNPQDAVDPLLTLVAFVYTRIKYV